MAILANELRIGNWIYYHKDETGSMMGMVALADLINIVLGRECASEYKPIELTPDILIKCGFEYYSETEIYKNYKMQNGFYISNCISDKYKDEAYGHSSGNWYCEQAFVPVNYLHKLQNLYFSLTGEELEINL